MPHLHLKRVARIEIVAYPLVSGYKLLVRYTYIIIIIIIIIIKRVLLKCRYVKKLQEHCTSVNITETKLVQRKFSTDVGN